MTDESEPEAPSGMMVLRTVAMPKDTNPNGDIFGGWIMSQMDLGGGTLAKEVAHGRVVTVTADKLTFVRPVQGRRHGLRLRRGHARRTHVDRHPARRHGLARSSTDFAQAAAPRHDGHVPLRRDRRRRSAATDPDRRSLRAPARDLGRGAPHRPKREHAVLVAHRRLERHPPRPASRAVTVFLQADATKRDATPGFVAQHSGHDGASVTPGPSRSATSTPRRGRSCQNTASPTA